MDFTINTYKKFLSAIQMPSFSVQTFADSFSLQNREFRKQNPKLIILRHDVDALPHNSLRFAHLQASFGISGTYYFRTVVQSYNETIIKEIASLGHEIGYHYETMDTARGNVYKAYDEFCRNLEIFRKIVPVETICMHGSPLSKFDNRTIWEKYDYRSLGIKAEPYFDLDFNKTFYLTDTGRRWDGGKVSIRDKAMVSNPVTNPDFLRRKYRTTFDVIKAIESDDFPDQVMMTFHPQRWTDNGVQWLQELVVQNLKNQVKRFLVR